MHRSSISRLVIATTFIAYVIGILAAVGHHLFYRSLAGTQAPDPNDRYKIIYKSYVSKQEVNIIGGTALAFLVKSALGTAISMAYVQLFWKTLMQSTHRTTLSMVDTTFSVLTSILSLSKVWTWWRYPQLFGIAAIAALLPLASIVTPATLTIVQKQITPPQTAPSQVPNVGFASLNYVDYMTPPPSAEVPAVYFYTGPSKAAFDIVQAVAAQGSVAAITPPAINTSWTVGFNGPALTCSDVPEQQSMAMKLNILNATSNITALQTCLSYGFLAWTAIGTGPDDLSTVPFYSTDNITYTLSTSGSNPISFNIPAILYMAALPSAIEVVEDQAGARTKFCNVSSIMGSQSQLDVLGENSTFIQCELVNASYSVSFDYRNGGQAVEVNTSIISANQSLFPISSVFGPSLTGWDGITPVDTSDGVPAPYVDATILETLSYQAIMQSFLTQILGSVSLRDLGAVDYLDTAIINTALMQAPELNFLTQPVVPPGMDSWGNEQYNTLQGAVAASNKTILNSLVNNMTVPYNTSLATMTEELFKNIVVSMMSAPELQPNYSSPFAPEKVVVTTYAAQNYYIYNAYRLWIAYGLAIAFTTFAVGTGILAIFENEGTYTHDFSTVLRIMHSGKLTVDLDDKNTDARGPLSDKLASAVVTLDKPDGMGTRARATAQAKDGSTIELLDYPHDNEGL